MCLAENGLISFALGTKVTFSALWVVQGVRCPATMTRVKHIKIQIKCHKKHSSICQCNSVTILSVHRGVYLFQFKASINHASEVVRTYAYNI